MNLYLTQLEIACAECQAATGDFEIPNGSVIRTDDPPAARFDCGRWIRTLQRNARCGPRTVGGYSFFSRDVDNIPRGSRLQCLADRSKSSIRVALYGHF